MKPGDLVMLIGRTHCSGVDAAGGRFVVFGGGAVGVYMGTVPDREMAPFGGDDLVLAGGKLVKCAQGVWSVLDETG